MTVIPDRCEFHRHGENVIYAYALEPSDGPTVAYRRCDKALWLRFLPDAGWVVVGEDQSVILSWPLDRELALASAVPPAGVWRSKKGEKSFLYSLVYPSTPTEIE